MSVFCITHRMANFQSKEESSLVNTSAGGSGINEYVNSLFDPTLTWQDVTWLKRCVSDLTLTLTHTLTLLACPMNIPNSKNWPHCTTSQVPTKPALSVFPPTYDLNILKGEYQGTYTSKIDYSSNILLTFYRVASSGHFFLFFCLWAAFIVRYKLIKKNYFFLEAPQGSTAY